MTEKHTYLKSHRLSGALMAFDMGAEDRALRERAGAAKAGRAAKTLVKEGALRLTLIALRKGVSLDEHAVEGAVSVQVLRGRIELRAGARALDLRTGGIAALDAGTRHAVSAASDCAILVTVAFAG